MNILILLLAFSTTFATASSPVVSVRAATATVAACALHENGDVACWGRNLRGHIPFQDKKPLKSPELISQIGKLKELKMTMDYACGITSASKLVCWGHIPGPDFSIDKNYRNPTNIQTPESLVVKDIALGSKYACVLYGSGEVSCWGENASGAQDSLTSMKSGNGKFKQLDTNLGHMCGLTEFGEIYCWGYKLGDKPVKMNLPFLTKKMAVEDRLCAISPQEALVCFDYNDTSNSVTKLDKEVKDLAHYEYRTCAQKGDDIYCWAPNFSFTPTKVQGNSQIDSFDTSCAKLKNQKVMCWFGLRKDQEAYEVKEANDVYQRSPLQ